jgi:hypothetical protein
VLEMKKMGTQKASMDDIYFVSAAAVADKIIEHMRRGSDPLQLSSFSFPAFPTGSLWKTRLRTKMD